jgi:excisionase family DNA binding protein
VTEQPTDPTLTVDDAALKMDVSRRTIYNWLNAGRLKYRRNAGGRIRIFAESLWREERPEATQ